MSTGCENCGGEIAYGYLRNGQSEVIKDMERFVCSMMNTFADEKGVRVPCGDLKGSRYGNTAKHIARALILEFDQLSGKTGEVVGWTIRKISRGDIETVSRILKTGGGTVKEVMSATSLSQRDAIGVVSYLLTTKFSDEGSKKLRSWWSNAVKGKTGEISEFSEVQKQLKEGKAADVSQIIQMLRSEVTSKEAQIGLDELGKYTSRPEVDIEASEVGTIGGHGRPLKDVNKIKMRAAIQAAYDEGYADGERNERARREARTSRDSEFRTGAVDQVTGKQSRAPIARLATKFGVSEASIEEILGEGW